MADERIPPSRPAPTRRRASTRRREPPRRRPARPAPPSRRSRAPAPPLPRPRNAAGGLGARARASPRSRCCCSRSARCSSSRCPARSPPGSSPLRARGRSSAARRRSATARRPRRCGSRRIGVIAGVAAAVVFIALLAVGLRLRAVPRRPRARARGAPRAASDGVRTSVDGAADGPRSSSGGSAALGPARLPPPRDAESLHQAVPHDRRPDPGAARGLAGDGRRRCSTTGRPPSTSSTSACSAACPHVFATANPVLAFAASGSGAMESAVANLVRPGTKALALRRGQVRRALDPAVRGLRRRPRRATSPAGASASTPAEVDRLLSRAPGRRGRLRAR